MEFLGEELTSDGSNWEDKELQKLQRIIQKKKAEERVIEKAISSCQTTRGRQVLPTEMRR